MKEEHFKNDAKAIVDTLFDAKLFKGKITRDDMVSTEEYISYAMQSRFESYIKAKELVDRINSKGEPK